MKPKVQTVKNKIVCSQRFIRDEDEPVSCGYRIPKKEYDWLNKNVDGNVNYVMAAILRRGIKELKIHLSLSEEDLKIRNLNIDIDYIDI